MAADQHPIILHQNKCVGCDLRVAGFFMKKQLWIVSVVLTGSFLLAQNPSARTADSPAAAGTQSAAKAKGPDRAAAYYHFALAHMYEEQVATYGRSELANKAIEEYRAAIDADPTSAYLTSGLAELYAKTGRIRDAVVEAQDIIKKNPSNLEARRLLGRIYLRSLGDMQAGSGSESVLKLAIEQYEQIVRLQPNSMDDHLLLGRLYRLNNDLQKAESEYKTEVKPEDAQTYVRSRERYRKERKLDLDRENLKKAESMVQDSFEVPYNIAAIYQAQGRYDEAIPIMGDLLKKSEKAEGKYSNGER